MRAVLFALLLYPLVALGQWTHRGEVWSASTVTSWHEHDHGYTNRNYGYGAEYGVTDSSRVGARLGGRPADQAEVEVIACLCKASGRVEVPGTGCGRCKEYLAALAAQSVQPSLSTAPSPSQQQQQVP